MNTPNLGYLYYKEYYSDDFFIKRYHDIDEKNKFEKKKLENYFNEKNNEIINSSNVDKMTDMSDISLISKEDVIALKTTYPGLIVGTGYNHQLKKQDEFKLGLEFDYTTGLPIINGSSVKGLLRSVFYKSINDPDNKKDEQELNKNKKEYIESIIINIKNKKDFKFKSDSEFEELTKEIFDGEKLKTSGDKSQEAVYENIPMYERDIFYDAIIDTEQTRKVKNKYNDSVNSCILGDDFITPHKNPLKNPIPIKFIKVMPDVVWKFQFALKDGKLINKDEKLKLFKEILLDLGIGAKTNVGYGKFEDIKKK